MTPDKAAILMFGFFLGILVGWKARRDHVGASFESRPIENNFQQKLERQADNEETRRNIPI